MSETSAEKFDPVQAADLINVLNLQAKWECVLGTPVGADVASSTTNLQDRQRQYEAFRIQMAAYVDRYKTTYVPDMTLNTPDRFGRWCRTVRAVCGRAEQVAGSVCPDHVVEKAYRVADRIAGTLSKDPVGRGAAPDSIGAAIRDLDAVIVWCHALDSRPIADLLPAAK